MKRFKSIQRAIKRGNIVISESPTGKLEVFRKVKSMSKNKESKKQGVKLIRYSY